MEFYVALTAIRTMEIFCCFIRYTFLRFQPSQYYIPELSTKWSTVCNAISFAIFYSISRNAQSNLLNRPRRRRRCRLGWFELKMFLSGVGKYGNFVTTQFQYTKNAV